MKFNIKKIRGLLFILIIIAVVFLVGCEPKNISSASLIREQSKMNEKKLLEIARETDTKSTTTDISIPSGTIIKNANIDRKLVALTFDDGPDNKVTPMIIDILDQYNVKASFFFIGSYVKVYPDVVKKAHESGHSILAHSYYHSLFTNKSYEYIYRDFEKTNEAIKNIIGVEPSMMRPPYGIVTDNVRKAAKNHNQQIILWSIDTLDWSNRDKDQIVENALHGIQPGDIILMHSIGKNEATAEALPEIIKQLRNKGYEIVRLEELLFSSQ